MSSLEWTLFLTALGGLLLATFAATAAKSCYEFSRREMQVYCRRRNRLERFNQIMDHYEDVGRSAETLRILSAPCFFLALITWAADLEEATRFEIGPLLFALAGGILVLLTGTAWLPWAVARLGATQFLFHAWKPLWWLSRLLMPLTWGVILFEAPLSRLVGRVQIEEDEEEAFEEEIRSIVTEGMYDGVLAPDAREMIEGVIELADGDVLDIMTPRSNIDAIDIDLPWPEILDLVIESGRTRYPVYEGKLDNIIGILYVKDLLAEYRRGHPRDLRELLRKPSFVPTTKPLNAMLQTFLRAHSHLAIVVDEYQSVAGVVTIEDVLEEIVGEIVDESDKEEENEIRWLSERTAEVLGTAHLDTVNQAFALELDEPDDYDTLAGLVISRLGRIPREGEAISVDGVQFTVIQANRRRIERLLVERDEPASESA